MSLPVIGKPYTTQSTISDTDYHVRQKTQVDSEQLSQYAEARRGSEAVLNSSLLTSKVLDDKTRIFASSKENIEISRRKAKHQKRSTTSINIGQNIYKARRCKEIVL